MVPNLFSPFELHGLTMRNRIAMSPMCMYSAAANGRVTPWHTTHYLTRAVGGVGVIIMEATAVEPRGRISAHDLGLWEDAQIAPLAELVRQVHSEGGLIGVQLAHAGRKAWSQDRGYGPEIPVSPSISPFAEDWRRPQALDRAGIATVVGAWEKAGRRAAEAGCDIVEIHGAHGYLIHQFLSPLTNQRTDAFGPSVDNGRRMLLEVTDAVRKVWPADKPLWVRLSATDWSDGGLTADDTVATARALAQHGVDLIDCSSGGLTPIRPTAVGPGYQVPFAAQVRRGAQIPTSAVGLITSPEYADAIIRTEQADMVSLGRELLRHPYWPLDAARQLGHDMTWPSQYGRAKL